MNDLVAKRYVKALIDSRDIQTINNISYSLNIISSAFGDEKFINMVKRYSFLFYLSSADLFVFFYRIPNL